MATTFAEQDHLLSVDDIIAITNTSERLVRRLIYDRALPTIKVGRYVRVRQSDLTAYLEAQTRPAARGGAR